ncbi:ferritin-like domain-containing protein [Nonomuraea sp. NPDC050202]|jgi:hypothetical protein|uniref:ferritin-like domain-containing protein n=1 Tax=Nonomuraea sp. NPDC050202 TaxID=3155035 RepID=UPI0034082591
MHDLSALTEVHASVATRFTWDYSRRNAKLRLLYDKAKAAQWDADRDIDWSGIPEYGAPLPEDEAASRRSSSSPVPPELWNQYRWEHHSWMTSQFLHGEQGAMLATARLVEVVPDLDAKFFAAIQVTDEARHVDAYGRYVQELSHPYPINSSLHCLLSHVISESRWDIIYLGMQIIVEGLALAAFRISSVSSFDPVIRQITDLVARDEARHVAYGVLSLEGFYDELTSAERADREDFIKEATFLMGRRFLLEDVWDRMDLDVRAGVSYVMTDPAMIHLRQLMFAKILTCLARIKLLTPGVRAHLEDLSLIRSRG